MKKIIALLLLVCLLCGCVTQTESRPTARPVTQPTQSATVPTTQPDENAYQEEPVELEVLTKHTFYQTSETPAVAVMDERAVAFVTEEFLNKDFSKMYTCIRLLDPYNGQVRAELQLEGRYSVSSHSNLEGAMVLTGRDSDQILVLDKNLREVLRFEARAQDGVLSADLTSYYYLLGSKLCCLDIATGKDSIHEAGQELLLDAIWDYDPQENVLLVSALEDSYTTNLCMAAIDLDDGSFKLLYRGIEAGRLAADGVCLEFEYLQEHSADLYFGDWTDDKLQVLPKFLVNDPDYSTWHIADSDYVFRLTYDQLVNIKDCRLYRLGQTLQVCSLQPYLKGAKINYTYALPDGNILLMAMGGRGYQTYLLCPDQLEFTDAQLETTDGAILMDATILENYDKEPIFELPEELADVRQIADRLEETYDVTILLSNQCALAASYCDMPITTTDRAGLSDEEAAIREALQILEEVLGLYPKDFFSQFKNEAGEKGMLVMLVEDIGSDFNAIGVSYKMGQWYPVAIDITSGEVKSTYCHEFWHATENRIYDLDKGALDLEAWNKINPPGFNYAGLTPDYYMDTQYTFFGAPAGEDIYFVDPYGKTMGEEDRARLMEYIMATNWEASVMMKYPALYAKMELMCQAIREAFDTEDWEDVRWERLLKNN